MIHKFGLCHLNDVSLHKGEKKICDEQYCIKEYRMLYYFSFSRFLSQRVFLSKFLTRHILLSMDTQGEVLWINCRPLIWYSYSDYSNYMIHTHIWFITLYVNIFINYLICIIDGLHVVSINKTFLSVIRHTEKLFLIFYSSFHSIIYYLGCWHNLPNCTELWIIHIILH